MSDPFDELEPVPEDLPEEPDHGHAAGDPEAAPPEDDPVAADCAALPLNDFGNGQRFGRYFGEDLMHVPRVGWHVWDGTRWRRDDDSIEVRAKAQQVSGRILAELPFVQVEPWAMRLIALARDAEQQIRRLGAPEPGTPDYAEERRLAKVVQDAALPRKTLSARKRELRSHARSSGNSGRIEAMMTEAAVGLSHPLSGLDLPPLAINTASGTLWCDVEEPGEGAGRVARVELRAHAREDRLTKCMPVEWRPESAAPRFEAFLERVQPDPEVRRFLQRWLGLSLTGLKHQALCFWYGGGANGKSVLSEVMGRLMGDYSATAKIESLVGSNRRSAADATPDLVPLIGARMVRASEPEEGQRLQEARVKELTGGEPILVRALNQDFVEVTPLFKLTISGNHKPEIRGGDDGIWRRIMLVPWEVTIPPEERDPQLVDRLMEEAPGILSWCVDGLIEFLEGGLAPPEKVMLATDEYRRASDPMGQFLTDACVVTGDPSDTIATARLVEAFNYWMLEQGGSQWKPRSVQLRLAEKDGAWRHPKSGKSIAKGKASVSQYVGLCFVDAFRRRFESAPRDHAGRIIGAGDEGVG